MALIHLGKMESEFDSIT